jgi:hypothetical protein
MFKRAVLEFDAPLCTCPKINYKTTIDSRAKGTVNVSCDDCHTQLTIPFAKFSLHYSIKNAPREENEEEFDKEGMKFYAVKEPKSK